eukprot:gene19936-21889_t
MSVENILNEIAYSENAILNHERQTELDRQEEFKIMEMEYLRKVAECEEQLESAKEHLENLVRKHEIAFNMRNQLDVWIEQKEREKAEAAYWQEKEALDAINKANYLRNALSIVNEKFKLLVEKRAQEPARMKTAIEQQNCRIKAIMSSKLKVGCANIACKSRIDNLQIQIEKFGAERVKDEEEISRLEEELEKLKLQEGQEKLEDQQEVNRDIIQKLACQNWCRQAEVMMLERKMNKSLRQRVMGWFCIHI